MSTVITTVYHNHFIVSEGGDGQGTCRGGAVMGKRNQRYDRLVMMDLMK